MKKLFKIAYSMLMMLSPLTLTSCQNENTLTVAEVTHSIFYAPQYVAKELGLFEKKGLNVNIITTPGADKVMASMLSKESDIGLMGPEATAYVSLKEKTNYAINFAQLTQRDGSFLLGREKIENFTLDMLKGKTIIGGRKGGMPEMTLEYVLKKYGLDVGRDDSSKEVNVRTDVQFDVMSGVFTSGQSDYVALFEPAASQVVNLKRGYIVASIGELGGTIPYTAYSSLNSTIKNKSKQLQKFVDCIKEANEYVATHTSEEIAKIIKPQFVSSSEKEIVDILNNYKRIDVWPRNLNLTKASFDKMLEIITMANELSDPNLVSYDKIVTDQFTK